MGRRQYRGRRGVAWLHGLIAGAGLLIMWVVPALRIFLREARLHAWQVYVGVAAMMLIAILLHGNPWQVRDLLAD
jgi:hypothetical protein